MTLDEIKSELGKSKHRMTEARHRVETIYQSQCELAILAYEAGLTPTEIGQLCGQPMGLTLGGHRKASKAAVDATPVAMPDIQPMPRSKRRQHFYAGRNT